MKKELESIPHLTDLIALMERLAPPSLAEDWDNCGLQIGSGDWLIRSIWVALDPLPTVVQAASDSGVDLLITHHPLFFRPLKRVDLGTSLGRILETAVKSHTAIYSAHTNLDSTYDGINDVLADMIGIQEARAMVPAKDAMEIDGVVRDGKTIGLGRIGDLDQPISAMHLFENLKKRFNLKNIRLAGRIGGTIRRVAVCSGAGSSLIDRFLKSDAELFITGDLRYHDARTVEEAGKVILDLGHFASEHIIVDTLAKKLNKTCRDKGWTLTVDPCTLECDPFVTV